jgi:hypothetical protein
MIRKLVLAAAAVVVLPLSVGHLASGAECDTWNAWSPAQHHTVAPIPVDVVGGHGYGSGYHGDQYESPPQPMGAYGDPQRQAGEGGYVQGRFGPINFNVNFFGQFDENDNFHNYDTVGGACVGVSGTPIFVSTGEKCVPTSTFNKPTPTWVPCDGY